MLLRRGLSPILKLFPSASKLLVPTLFRYHLQRCRGLCWKPSKTRSLMCYSCLLRFVWVLESDEGLRGVSDGLSIYVSICLVVAAISFSNIWPTRQFHALSKSNNHTSTLVIRDGTKQQILANDAVVGDLVCLKIGDQVPADGLYIDGNSFQVNEANSLEIINGHNPFLLAGSKVTQGDARMLVTAVDTDSG